MTRMKLKVKELRKKSEKELKNMLSETDKEIAKFRAVSRSPSGEGLISLPTGRMQGVRWGHYQTLKKNKAIILTVLTENKKARMKI